MVTEQINLLGQCSAEFNIGNRHTNEKACPLLCARLLTKNKKRMKTSHPLKIPHDRCVITWEGKERKKRKEREKTGGGGGSHLWSGLHQSIWCRPRKQLGGRLTTGVQLCQPHRSPGRSGWVKKKKKINKHEHALNKNHK